MFHRCLLLLLSVAGSSPAAELTVDRTVELAVDQIIDRHIQARGGLERIKAIQNLVYSNGQYQEADYLSDGTASMSLGRPFLKLVGDKNNTNNFPNGFMEGYDGSAWEWFGDPGIVIRTVGEASEAIRHYAGVDGPLVDYKAKGSTARLVGEVELDGHDVYVIELTRRDDFVEQFYINKETFLIDASGGSAPIHAFGDDVISLTRIGDYRAVAGVQIPHRFGSVQLPSGETLSSMQWGKVEANVDLPDDWFSPPKFERNAYQLFIEHMFGQRDDIGAVMWTYHEFRLAYPDVDTSDAAQIAGYQILKMGQIENAIALLEQNARDYPNGANAHFGLGRAYQTAGRMVDARASFERALQLDPEHERAARGLSALNQQATP